MELGTGSRKAREELAVSPELAFYHPERETTLHVDASRLNGLGFILKKRDANTNEWRMVQAGSRFLSPAESRYAMIELECLAAVWAIKKCRQFIQGLQPHHGPSAVGTNSQRIFAG